MSNGFQRTLDHIRSIADSEAHKGRLFERLMKTYFGEDPVYKERFSQVWLWSEWASIRPGFDGADTGIDLVAEEREGGYYCAIQCKCYAPGTRISKPHLDSFIAASARDPFTARIVVDTGDGWGPNARKTIAPLKPACTVLRFGDLASRPFDWPDLVHDEPEALSYRGEPFSLRPHQKTALDDVTGGFEAQDRGQLIMACGTGKTFAALRIAEAVAGIGGRVLYLVPSISLFQQSMREWATQRAIPHRYIGICSDTRAGRNDEDASLQELEIPVTTDPSTISRALRLPRPDAITVVFCTYHSLGIVERAQDDGAPYGRYSFDVGDHTTLLRFGLRSRSWIPPVAGAGRPHRSWSCHRQNRLQFSCPRCLQRITLSANFPSRCPPKWLLLVSNPNVGRYNHLYKRPPHFYE